MEKYQVPLLRVTYRMDPDFQGTQGCLLHQLSSVFSPKADKDDNNECNARENYKK